MPMMPNEISPAAYRIVSRDDGGFGVEVSIEGTSPTMVTSFPTESAANDWIAAHKARLAAPKPKRWRAR
jgi:hypothetical protein